MKHCSTEALVDFVLGLLPSQNVDEVKHHLEGCKKCLGSYDMWRTVMGAGRRENQYRPSESAVQRAKEAFAFREGLRPLGRKTRARLIFDSFSQPLPGGARNSFTARRQLQYRSGPLIIDIDITKVPHPPETPILLMGQILNAEKPDQHVKNFRVFLVRGTRAKAQMNSSELGEFRFELAFGKKWKLLFKMGDQQVIPIDLPELW